MSSGVRGHQLDTAYRALKELDTAELKSLLEDDEALHEIFEAHLPNVREKQNIVREIKSNNEKQARFNLERKEAFDKLQIEVEQLRQIIKDRQGQLYPLLESVKDVQQKDSKEGIIARLRGAIQDSEKECNDLAATTSPDTNWNAFVNDFVKKRKTLHYRQEFLERLQHAEK
mmetsp:Transcript_11081/g.17416  ORF Transcript_11081/g.17416 Transcript_11081/m.17416 type:complete len:172 (-) Transcript_11081:137-652(-)|eukprot:CAMPEP_0184312536 /NCGR_PEP_ID=MMETSP1049-20130417/50656_1 /TAXON_ID=77928 /ORGANISM="Proteomonas sulcata, Strain CCMP704" /LENGTH=171 /DNA_ID=CAMNT_0026628769 /DNA_START=112 /DNA_END=627 /DNA_ORIENTATION=-